MGIAKRAKEFGFITRHPVPTWEERTSWFVDEAKQAVIADMSDEGVSVIDLANQFRMTTAQVEFVIQRDARGRVTQEAFRRIKDEKGDAHASV